jgi:flagellar export protein FliJ
MKAFNFSLESLRTLRQQKERAAQQRYAKTLVACKKAEGQLAEAVAALEAGRKMIESEFARGVTAGQFAGLRTGCLVLEIRWRERQVALLEARRVAELMFREMTFATREREGLDRFHDREQRNHLLAFRRDEQKMFDEMAAQAGGGYHLLQPA